METSIRTSYVVDRDTYEDILQWMDQLSTLSPALQELQRIEKLLDSMSSQERQKQYDSLMRPFLLAHRKEYQITDPPLLLNHLIIRSLRRRTRLACSGTFYKPCPEDSMIGRRS